MSQQELITPENIHAYLEQHQQKELCRFVTVGSVDDGKSTLIGRLLHDTHGIYEDQLAAVKKATKQDAGEVDFSLFTDGLKAEREQGITIDVAYRYFSTAKRKFIIADTPGHVQYTRNMATGASTANVAIILIDARLGVLQQSRRHAYIASLLGIPHLAVCVNKMDLKGWSQEVFESIRREFSDFAGRLGFNDVKFIPISAKLGDNVVDKSKNISWYEPADGAHTLLEYLETVPVTASVNQKDFRFPVQYVLRPHLNYRGFAGTIASGSLKKGDTLMVLPSGKSSQVVSIDTFDGELEQAHAPMAVTVRLADEIDISRGDMLVHPTNVPDVTQRFNAKIVWMSEKALDRHQSYYLKHTTQSVRADIETVHFIVDLNTLEQKPANRLELNDIGEVTVACHRSLFFDPYRDNRATGAFILVDALTNNTVAAGMIQGPAPVLSAAKVEALKAAKALPKSRITAEERAERLGQKGAVVWLTGLPGAGKSELAYELERQLFDRGQFATVVDPDDGLSRGVHPDGSSPVQTPELARRATEAGLLAVFAYASPLRADRAALRDAVGAERFVEVHVATPLETCKQRDVRGAYDPTHADPRYEAPQDPDVLVSLDKMDAAEAASRVIARLVARGLLPSKYSL
jgi:bifunctional enzyme CysN/CysC